MGTESRFGPTRRVKRRADFLRIQAKGKKFSGRNFLLIVHPPIRSSTQREFRFGATITTKVDKRAARRNRLRRRLRECFRLTRAQLQGPAADLVIIARSGSVELDYEQVRKEFHYLLYKAGLLRSERRNEQRNKPSHGGKKAVIIANTCKIVSAAYSGALRGLNYGLVLLALLIIAVWRYGFSPWIGSHCRFHPTCSQYATQCLRQYGFIPRRVVESKTN